MSNNTTPDPKKIEEAIAALQQNPSDELLAHALTVIRHQMQAHTELIVAIDSNPVINTLSMRTMNTPDGKTWFYAFTSPDEQLKGNNALISGFSSEISKLFDMTLATPEVEGLLINPWGCTIRLSKHLIQIVIG